MIPQRNQKIAPKYFGKQKAVSPLQAIRKERSSVTPVGSTGTTMGSSRPQAPDQASVTQAAIAERVAGTPRSTEHDEQPMPRQEAPGAPNYAHQSKEPVYMNQDAQRQATRSRQKMAKGIMKKNRLRGSFR